MVDFKMLGMDKIPILSSDTIQVVMPTLLKDDS